MPSQEPVLGLGISFSASRAPGVGCRGKDLGELHAEPGASVGVGDPRADAVDLRMPVVPAIEK